MDFDGLKITVVGDILLDRWIYGRVDRISPEAPVPVFVQESIREMSGGAGNVCANLLSLGCNALIAGTFSGNCSVKTRYVAAGQQVMRVDEDFISPESKAYEDHFFDFATSGDPQALVISDYAKGICTPMLCGRLINWAIHQGIPVVVDPKGKSWRKYEGCTLITPNEAEYAAWEHDCNFPAILRTMGSKGVELLRGNELPFRIEANVRDVYDVVGCGDTIAAVVAAGLARGLTMEDACGIANAAAGVVAAKRGTSVCTIDELNASLTS